MPSIVFDLDGTLIDSVPDLHAASVALLQDEGKPPVSLEQTRSFVGNGIPKLIQLTAQAVGLAQDDASQNRLVEGFLAHYNRSLTGRATFYPGLLDCLAAFKAKGYRMGVCTNKPIAQTRIILDDLGLAQYFDNVVGGDSFSERKPHPMPLIEAFGTSMPEQCLYVGDSEVDSATAEAAGIPFALFTLGYRKTPIDALPHVFSFEHYDALVDYADEKFSA